jgi:hypothetical protein
MKLKDLLEFKKGRLNEEVVEPSEQIIKGVQKELKMKTGIIAVLGLDKKKPEILYYMSDLSKEIRTPILQSLFNSMTLDVSCSTLTNSVGGYMFNVSINYTHPGAGSNGRDIGTIWYQDGKFKSRFNTATTVSVAS